MSKLCIAIFNNFPGIGNTKKQIDLLLNSFNLGIFYEQSNDEPVLSEFQNKSNIICSLSDNCIYNNCEMLLLPDNCFLNGKSNAVPFQERLSQIEEILKAILNNAQKIDLFIGDSGANWDDYVHYDINIHEFLRIASSLNSMNPPDLHFIIKQ